MKRSGRLRAVITATSLAIVAAACGKSSSTSTPSPDGSNETDKPVVGGNLVDYQNFSGGAVGHIDPALSDTLQGSQPGELLFDGLADYDYRTGDLKPAVAESWSSNADATVWTFKVRPGVKWSNGDPVLPSDFKFAWERVVDRKMASHVAYHFTDNARIVGTKEIAAGTATDASGIKADDANLTLTVQLETPLSFFPDVTANLAFSPVPKKVVQALPDQTKWEQGVMIGDGPYKEASPWNPDEGVKLLRSDTYWGGIHDHKAYIDSIDFRVSKDVDSAWASFEAGQGQIGHVPPAEYADAKARYGGHNSIDLSADGLYYWAFNMNDPVVGGPQNIKLRQAISEIIDKQKIVSDVYNGARKVATGVTPPGIPGFKSGLSTLPMRDVAKAKATLAEWEQATGRQVADLPPVKLQFNAGAGHEPVATIIQANLQELGIKAELDARDSRTFTSEYSSGKIQFYALGWVADYNSYDNMLYPLFGQAATANFGQYKSPQFEDLTGLARKTTDLARRNDLYNQAERLVLNTDTAIVPLNWYSGTIAWSERLHNVIQSPLLFVAYDEMWLAK